MASTLRDSIVHWRKKLDRTTDESTVLNVIHKLAKVPITVELLQSTGIGKVIRSLAKESGKVGMKASSVLHNWRDVVASAQKTERPQKIDRKENTKTSHKKQDPIMENSATLKHHKNSISLHEKQRKNTHLLNSEEMSKMNENFSPTDTAKQLDCKYLLLGTPRENVTVCDDGEHNDVKCSSHSFQISITKDWKKESSKFHHSKKCKLSENLPSVVKNAESDRNKMRISPKSDTTSKQHAKKLRKQADYKLPHKQKDRDNLDVTSKALNNKIENTLLDLNVNDNEESICPTEFIGDLSEQISVKLEKDFPIDCSKKREKEKRHKSGDKNNHKHSQKSKDRNRHNGEKSHSKSLEKYKKETETKSSSEPKKVFSIEDAEAFTSSEVRFEDCLSFNDIVPLKRRKSSKMAAKKTKHHSNKAVSMRCDITKDSTILNDIKKQKYSPEKTLPLETSDIHVPTLIEVDISSTLPQTQPNYRPLPQRNYDSFPIKKKVLSNEDAIRFTSSRKEKTAIYSGRKALVFTSVPSLFDSCIRILIENIDAIDYLGNLPYFLLKPVLERCTSVQLHNLEHYNPYLLEDTHELWEIHCKRDFRNHVPDENETWRDLYWRASEEREAKLKRLTNNIAASMTKTGPGRQVKLAYVDTVVKPPRDIARKQAKHGTSLPVNHTIKAAPPSKATPRPTAPVINSKAAAVVPIIPKKPRVAPLMAKTLKSMKSCFRR